MASKKTMSALSKLEEKLPKEPKATFKAKKHKSNPFANAIKKHK